MTQCAPPVWPVGFLAGSVCAGIKKQGVPDLALILGESPLTAAAVFTKNLVCAAPIQLSKSHLAYSHTKISALLINSGCANAATGAEGLTRARRATTALAALLHVDATTVLTNSTGVIGVQLPVDRIEAALPSLVASVQAGSCESFARAIMTTDTRPKWSTRTIHWTVGATAHTCRVTGVAKGAGMIHPNMATMIAVLATDATCTPHDLDALLRHAVDRSFHRISVDGDTSTNDSVFALASCTSGTPPAAELAEAFDAVAQDLALLVVRDGEGFERGIEVRVIGAKTSDDALQVARTIAMSLLVRTAVTGGDPNWGRILAAAGRAGVAFNPETVRLSTGGIELFAHGAPTASDLAAVRLAFTAELVRIELDLSMGSASDHFWSCGLTKRYVEINADYTT